MGGQWGTHGVSESGEISILLSLVLDLSNRVNLCPGIENNSA